MVDMDFAAVIEWLRDEEIALKRVQGVGYLLDDALPIPKTNYRIGLDPILGVVPVAGDVIVGIISLYIVAEGINLGASRGVLARMIVNVLLDVTIGSIPIIGTLFDAFWKANRRNVALLERHVGERIEAERE